MKTPWLLLRFLILMLAVALASVLPANADPLGTYTFTGDASGTLGTVSFSDVPLTVTASGDTSGVFFRLLDSTYILDFPANTATFSLSGVGSGTFSDATDVFDNQAVGSAGFTDGSDLIQVHDGLIGSTAFATYDLKSSIGPLGPESSNPSTSDWVNIPTSGGPMTVTSLTNVTFQASVVPEPSTFVLLGLGLIGVGMWRAGMRGWRVRTCRAS